MFDEDLLTTRRRRLVGRLGRASWNDSHRRQDERERCSEERRERSAKRAAVVGAAGVD
jgi:hypothetical protein